jgi:hypothetical protein
MYELLPSCFVPRQSGMGEKRFENCIWNCAYEVRLIEQESFELALYGPRISSSCKVALIISA